MRIAFLPGEYTCTGKFYGTLPASRLAAAGHEVICELAPPDLELTEIDGVTMPKAPGFRNLDMAVLIRPAQEGIRPFVDALSEAGTLIVHCIDDWVLSEGSRIGLYGGDALQEVIATYPVADAFVASTPRIAENLAPYGKPVWQQQIALWDEHYAHLPARDHSLDDEIVIGWVGVGWIRPYDLVPIRSVVRRILDEHDHVRFLAVGDDHTLQILGIDGHPRASSLPLQPLELVPQTVARHVDIALAPVARNESNRAKTALKVMEAWGAGAVPVASSWQPEYARAISHGTNGMLADRPREWQAALEALVTDRKLLDKCRAGATVAARACFASTRGDDIRQMYEDILTTLRPAAPLAG